MINELQDLVSRTKILGEIRAIAIRFLYWIFKFSHGFPITVQCRAGSSLKLSKNKLQLCSSLEFHHNLNWNTSQTYLNSLLPPFRFIKNSSPFQHSSWKSIEIPLKTIFGVYPLKFNDMFCAFVVLRFNSITICLHIHT